MKILKRGTKSQKSLENKIWRKKCDKCGCKYEFEFSDIYIAKSWLLEDNYYVNCPQCSRSHFVTHVK